MEYIGYIKIEDMELSIWRKSLVYEVDENGEEIGSISIFKVKNKADLIDEVNKIYKYYLENAKKKED